jgi:ribosomal protein S18 acetylase RimI-like enzyme
MTDTTDTTDTTPFPNGAAAAEPFRQAAGADTGRIAEALALAFHDDPVFRWCLPDAARRAEALPSFFEQVTRAVLPHGEVHVGVGTRAASLSVPPGVAPVAEEDGPAFEASLAALLGEDAHRAFAIMALLDQHHPTEPHRFLWFVGVEPQLQGRGVGSMLLRALTARSDREVTPAYLDATSPHNRRLYERHGFEVVAERSVDGSPPLWAMWREPRA